MKIEVLPYDPSWAKLFVRLRAELSLILKDFNPQIEHIGSTSVAGLSAKPVIDIMVGLSEADHLDATVSPMLAHPYIYYQLYNTIMPERRLFLRLRKAADIKLFQQEFREGDSIPHETISRHRLAHVHIWKKGTEDWIRHLAFRDYLKVHPEVRHEYEKLKLRLSQQEWTNGNAYNQAKDTFIKSEERKALAWYHQQPSDAK